MEKAADILKLMKFVLPVYHAFYSSCCIHEVDERKTDETVRLTRIVSSFLNTIVDSDSDFDNELKMLYAVFTRHRVKY